MEWRTDEIVYSFIFDVWLIIATRVVLARIPIFIDRKEKQKTVDTDNCASQQLIYSRITFLFSMPSDTKFVCIAPSLLTGLHAKSYMYSVHMYALKNAK